MTIDPKLRSAGLHIGTALSASVATAMWLSTQSVDIYSIVDQFNAVIKSVMTLLSSVGVLITSGIAVYKATTKGLVSDVNEIAKQPESPVRAVITEPTPEGRALAESLPGPVVMAGGDKAERLAK